MASSKPAMPNWQDLSEAALQQWEKAVKSGAGAFAGAFPGAGSVPGFDGNNPFAAFAQEVGKQLSEGAGAAASNIPRLHILSLIHI